MGRSFVGQQSNAQEDANLRSTANLLNIPGVPIDGFPCLAAGVKQDKKIFNGSIYL
ncbi:hypothetical protein [Candidatus Cardinium hertigii]|uniref:hypothetical protein n=1 Tax=Candidatus Cardinium hertigii TaxID=247481 RepID=UPI0013A53B6B|nr:hypothetical protein [Candidatus Cardinium hertigii]